MIVSTILINYVLIVAYKLENSTNAVTAVAYGFCIS